MKLYDIVLNLDEEAGGIRYVTQVNNVMDFGGGAKAFSVLHHIIDKEKSKVLSDVLGDSSPSVGFNNAVLINLKKLGLRMVQLRVPRPRLVEDSLPQDLGTLVQELISLTGVEGNDKVKVEDYMVMAHLMGKIDERNSK